MKHKETASTMFDTIETIGTSVVQHGKLNNRVYLMKFRPDDCSRVLEAVEGLARKYRYSKVFAKVPESVVHRFLEEGYHQEAVVPGFYRGRDGAVFMARFPDPLRASLSRDEAMTIHKVIDLARTRANAGIKRNTVLKPRPMEPEDASHLSRLYARTFETYPFPILDEAYIREVMAGHCEFFGIYDNERLVAASSSELDIRAGNAEMTDFATLSSYRGKSLSAVLLRAMENEMLKRGMRTLYTIARATSRGMNITFSKLGYTFSGTLVNNTNIAGRIESMNVWYRHLGSNLAVPRHFQ